MNNKRFAFRSLVAASQRSASRAFRFLSSLGVAPFVALAFVDAAAALGADGALLVGAARVETTPTEFPVKVNGDFLPRYLSEVSDPLNARAIVVDDGTTRFAFCALDACEIDSRIRDEVAAEVAKTTEIPADCVLIATTHCHSAPSLALALGCDLDEKYVEFVKPKIAEAIVRAYENRRPARVGFGVEIDRSNVFCRNFLMKPGTAFSLPSAFTGSKRDDMMMNPGFNNENAISRAGVPDPSVSVLAFETLDGEPLALLANYSLHYVGAQGISSDYYGVFAEKIAEKLGAGPDFVAAMTNGTSGDVNAIDFLDPNREYDKESVAESVANAAKTAFDRLDFQENVPIGFATSQLELATRKPSAEDVAEARAYVAEKGLDAPNDVRSVYAFETIAMEDDPGTRTLRLQAFRVGDVAIGAAPAELYAFTGLDLKANSPAKNSMIVSLANGCFGYVPTVWTFDRGGYNTWRARSNCLEIEAEPKIRAEIQRLWKTLF